MFPLKWQQNGVVEKFYVRYVHGIFFFSKTNKYLHKKEKLLYSLTIFQSSPDLLDDLLCSSNAQELQSIVYLIHLFFLGRISSDSCFASGIMLHLEWFFSGLFWSRRCFQILIRLCHFHIYSWYRWAMS